MEENSKLDDLIELSEKPFQAITSAGKKGVKGLGKIIGICIGLALLNLIFFCIGIYRLTVVEYHAIQLVYLSLSLFAGAGVVIFTAYRGYQYCLMETMKDIYQESKQLFYAVCEKIIIQCETILKGTKTIGDKNLSQAIQIKNIVEEKYKTFPSLVKKALIVLFNKLPLSHFLVPITQDIISGNRSGATDKLFQKVDEFMQESVFGMNSLRWIFSVLLVNIVAQILIVWFLIV